MTRCDEGKTRYLSHAKATQLLRRKVETPIFDTMMRNRPVKGKAFR